jgi:hypothetical protein
MGLVTLDLPLVGQPNTTEDVKVRNNFQTLQNTINGNIDTPNLTPALLASLGSNKQVYSAKQVLEVGQVGQIRAGRVLTPADFTNMGLSAPLGLWNLSNLNDSSGNARNLTNKGSVTFDTGITGAASEAAVFTGSTAQALYIADTGAADPFRIRTGSWGCWFRTAKRGTAQDLITKWGAAGGTLAYNLFVASGNNLVHDITIDGSTGILLNGISDVADDRWHFTVATHDGTRMRLYLDGAMESSGAASGAMGLVAAPLNIGAQTADASTAAANPFYGRLDEAFVTADVLSDDQVRNLYCASLGHTLGSIPSGSRLAVRRRRRGTTIAVSDFPATPARLHNFTAGALTDEGSNATGLTSNPGTGAIVAVDGPAGTANGYSFSGAHTGLSATDAGLPSGTTARSYGAWCKSAGTAGNKTVMGWGTVTTADARIDANATVFVAYSGADVITTGVSQLDGLWHFVVVVEDNTAIDLVKRKIYIDGRLVGNSTVLTSLILAGANAFRIGAAPGGTQPWIGQIGGAFVYAGALTPSQVLALYNVAGQQLALSPKSDADHIEAFEASRVLAAFDSIEGTDLVDLTVIS